MTSAYAEPSIASFLISQIVSLPSPAALPVSPRSSTETPVEAWANEIRSRVG
jgi:hypothetical protein